jgi:uncharacterized membrane protein
MEWLVFAIFAYFFWTATNLISKVLLSKHVKSVFVYAILMGFFGLVPLALTPFKPLTLPRPDQFVVALAAGVVFVFAMLPFYKALSIEDVSRVVPLWRLKPVFVLLFSFIFLGSRLNRIQILAFFLLLAGGFLISLRKTDGLFKLSKGFYYMSISSVLFGAYHTLTKYVYLNQAYYDGFLLIRLGSFLGVLVLLFFKHFRIGLKQTWHAVGGRVKAAIVAHQLLNLGGLAFFNYAISVGDVSLVVASQSLHTLFVFIAATIITLAWPSLVKEDLSFSIVLQKLGAIALIALGTLLVALF